MGEQKAEEKEEPSEILYTTSERLTRGSQIKSPYFFFFSGGVFCLPQRRIVKIQHGGTST